MNKTRFKNRQIYSIQVHSLAIFALKSKNNFFVTHTAIGHFKCIRPSRVNSNHANFKKKKFKPSTYRCSRLTLGDLDSIELVSELKFLENRPGLCRLGDACPLGQRLLNSELHFSEFDSLRSPVARKQLSSTLASTSDPAVCRADDWPSFWCTIWILLRKWDSWDELLCIFDPLSFEFLFWVFVLARTAANAANCGLFKFTWFIGFPVEFLRNGGGVVTLLPSWKKKLI